MNIVSNSYEHSLSTGNLDIVVERPTNELVIALKDAEGDPIQQIELTVEQAQALRAHLNSTAVQSLFGTQTGYHKAVRITEPLGVRA